eukprot:CAMPEP_0178487836 /NCGR_PEP_ID=MMETSP0696-20121128/9531_1 /TAXON_ID=265572 /ORGANISM="Extubocellulus spinifer, Strain CCMP396" /LENGTH=128 /DNA_ID=CAMNT_0020115549 /DNA_START=588 /DNA_END=971 /DNA_ORIENTATION=-
MTESVAEVARLTSARGGFSAYQPCHDTHEQLPSFGASPRGCFPSQKFARAWRGMLIWQETIGEGPLLRLRPIGKLQTMRRIFQGGISILRQRAFPMCMTVSVRSAVPAGASPNIERTATADSGTTDDA